MPLPNRVAPDGTLHADRARGTLMGNRGGVLHSADRRAIVRVQASRRWIACRLHFKDRRRQVWRSGYTELFFLDEVTALAAGHRPCFECRRDDAKAFAAALARHLGQGRPLPADAIDRALVPDRITGRAAPRRIGAATLARLPDGAVIRRGDAFLGLRGGHPLLWTFAGWRPVRETEGEAMLVTPAAALGALENGYRPGWHPSAEAAGAAR